MRCGPCLFVVIVCKTRFTLIDHLDDYIRMTHADYPDVLWSGCIMKVVRISMLCQRRLFFLESGEAETSFAFPWGGLDRRTALCISLGESGWWWFGWWCVPRVTVRCVPHVSQREGSLQLGWGFWDLTSLKRSNRLIKVSTRREGERLPSGWEDKHSNSCPGQLWKLLGFLE